jgi:hypothetical protein
MHESNFLSGRLSNAAIQTGRHGGGPVMTVPKLAACQQHVWNHDQPPLVIKCFVAGGRVFDEFEVGLARGLQRSLLGERSGTGRRLRCTLTQMRYRLRTLLILLVGPLLLAGAWWKYSGWKVEQARRAAEAEREQISNFYFGATR